MELTNGAQPDPAPFLFSPDVIDAITQEEKHGIFTSERFARLHPERFEAAVQMLASGEISQAAIARMVQCHHRTIAAISLKHADKIDAVRTKLAAKLRLLASQQIDRAIDDPTLIPKNVIGLVISQALTTAELLSGGPTSRIETTERRKATPEDINAMIDSLPEIKATTETGNNGGERPAIADRTTSGGMAKFEQVEAQADFKSVESQGNEGSATQGATLRATPGDADPSAKGGGGGAPISDRAAGGWDCEV